MRATSMTIFPESNILAELGKVRGVIGPAFVDRVAHVRPNEESVEAETVRETFLVVGHQAKGERLARSHCHRSSPTPR